MPMAALGLGQGIIVQGEGGMRATLEEMIREDLMLPNVWRAQTSQGRVVVVKQPIDPLRYQTEKQALQQLRTPHAATLLDVNDALGILFLEYVEGGELGKHIGQIMSDHFLWGMVMGAYIAGIIETLHGQGIVHGDVKPSNVLLGPEAVAFAQMRACALPEKPGWMKLVDYEAAKRIEGGSLVNIVGDMQPLGTWPYWAPERMLGKEDPKMDIYSWGVVRYRMKTGRFPFLFRVHREKEAALRLLESYRRLWGPSEQVVLRALHPDPSQRPDAKELFGELRAELAYHQVSLSGAFGK